MNKKYPLMISILVVIAVILSIIYVMVFADFSSLNKKCVKITGVSQGNIVGEAETAILPTFTDKTITFGTKFIDEKDSVTYNVIIKNCGLTDVKLDKVKKKGENKLITFKESGLKKGDVLKAGETDIYKAKLIYNPDLKTKPSSFTINYTLTFEFSKN